MQGEETQGRGFGTGKKQEQIIMTEHKKGVLMVIAGASMWGCSGVAAQYLFQQCAVTPEWLVVVRMLLSGCILLSLDCAISRNSLIRIWKERHDAVSLILFGIFGIMAVQYTYFAAIKYGNAATATVLQYLMPVIIVIYESFRRHSFPLPREIRAVMLAIMGTFLLVTHGKPDSLAVSEETLFWGILSAFAAAFYTVQPKKLLRRYRAPLVVGWGMIVGGVSFLPICLPWDIPGTWDALAPLVFTFIILFGTVIAFGLYLGSLRYLQPQETGLLGTVEPLSAIIFTVLLMNIPFGLMDVIGSLCIISTVFIVAKK